MITLKVAMSGTDKNGNSFSCSPGESVELDERSEASLIENDMAEKADKRRKRNESKSDA